MISECIWARKSVVILLSSPNALAPSNRPLTEFPIQIGSVGCSFSVRELFANRVRVRVRVRLFMTSADSQPPVACSCSCSCSLVRVRVRVCLFPVRPLQPECSCSCSCSFN